MSQKDAVKMLHELSVKALSLRKHREQRSGQPAQDEDANLDPSDHLQERLAQHQPSDTLSRLQRQPPLPWTIPNPTWSTLWLHLVCFYFSKLTWPDAQEPQLGSISLLEIMLDLFISFQTCGPANIRGNKITVKVALPMSASNTSIAYMAPYLKVFRGEAGNYFFSTRNCITQLVWVHERGPLTLCQAYPAKRKSYFPVSVRNPDPRAT